jgi:hypothetical protein
MILETMTDEVINLCLKLEKRFDVDVSSDLGLPNSSNHSHRV